MHGQKNSLTDTDFTNLQVHINEVVTGMKNRYRVFRQKHRLNPVKGVFTMSPVVCAAFVFMLSCAATCEAQSSSTKTVRRIRPRRVVVINRRVTSAPITQSAQEDSTAAQRSLAERGLAFTEEMFLERAKASDEDAVKTFLRAGMNPDDANIYPNLSRLLTMMLHHCYKPFVL
jgi:hypothetical protein